MSLNNNKLILAHEKGHTMLCLKVPIVHKILSSSLICHACLSAHVLAKGGTAIADF